MKSLQTQLFEQLHDKSLFKQAQQGAFSYLDEMFCLPVVPDPQACEALKQFEEPLPEQLTSPETLIQTLTDVGNQTVVNQNTGRYFGFVNGGALPVSLAAKWLCDVWDQNAALQIMSPLAAKLEQQCQNWLVELFNLPKQTVAGLVGGTSVATLCGLAAGRYRQYQKLGWNFDKEGMMGAPKLRIVLGRQTHGTVLKALKLLGFGENALEWVDCDAQGRMRVEALPQLNANCLLILQAGNVNSGAFDDFSALCALAKKAQAWVHVDGAFGMWAAASARFDKQTKSIEMADSWSVDGHKTLNTPYDCGVVLCADPPALTHALQQQGSYIQFSDNRDSMVFTPDMSRRARGIELWASMKYLGRRGIEELVDMLHQNAQYFASQLTSNGFEVLNQVVFNQVIVRCSNDALTQATLDNIQASGKCWCGGSLWQGMRVIRVSVCSWATTKNDIDASVQVFIASRQEAKQ